MKRLPPPDPAWVARAAKAGVRVELFDTLDDDDDYLELEASVLRATRDGTLPDEDLYPLLARYWIGRPPLDWPPDAAAVARRCAVALAGRPIEAVLRDGVPSDRTRQLAQDAVIKELRLSPPELLGVLADHWQELARWHVPSIGGYTLLEVARQLLLEPLAGACMLMWSTLHPGGGERATDPPAPTLSGWQEWSIVADDDWIGDAAAELVRLGQPARRRPDHVDQGAALLARARARLLDDYGLVAASIVQTSGWPGERSLVQPLAARALKLAVGHIDDIRLRARTDWVVDEVKRRLMPEDDALIDWVRDPSFATLGNPMRRLPCTAEEMRNVAASWLTWSLADAAVDVVAEMGNWRTATQD